MNNSKDIISVIDIGSSKISCIQSLTEINGISTIIGEGIIATKGIKAGIITDFNLANDSILRAIKDCEKQSGHNINKLVVSISSHKCFTKFIKSKKLIKEDRVLQEDIQSCINDSLEDEFFIDKKIINISSKIFSIDSSNGITNPLGMFGKEIEIEFLVTYVGLNQFKNYIECITSCNVDVNRIIFSIYAAGLAVLNEGELELGSVIVEMGARTTSIGIFSNSKFIFSNVINFGGDDITEALARKLSVSCEEAEKLKVMHGSVLDTSKENEMLLEIPSINFENEDSYVQVSNQNIYDTIRPFYDEILIWINNSIDKSGNSNLIGRVMIFTGGASQIEGLSILANNKYNFNSRIGVAKNIKFKFNHTLDASHSVIAGLIQNELNLIDKNKVNSLAGQNKNIKKKINFTFIKQWLAENFF